MYGQQQQQQQWRQGTICHRKHEQRRPLSRLPDAHPRTRVDSFLRCDAEKDDNGAATRRRSTDASVQPAVGENTSG